MNANPIPVSRDSTILRPDQSRVLLRPFSPGDSQRVASIIARIMSLPEDRVGFLLEEISAEFSQRHQQIHNLFLDRFEQVREMLLTDEGLSEERRLLIGSYFETDAGWLVLNHGVGPMRKYCIGAFLLDRDDPSKVLGRLRESLLKVNQNEREGYVPNVVYTCGALFHQGELIIPYGLADHATGFATVRLDEVLAAIQPDDE
jgi:predicted GH43/DUF377 family glycosyl hydrolase